MGSTYKHLGEKKLINKEHVGRGRKKRKKKWRGRVPNVS